MINSVEPREINITSNKREFKIIASSNNQQSTVIDAFDPSKNNKNANMKGICYINRKDN